MSEQRMWVYWRRLGASAYGILSILASCWFILAFMGMRATGAGMGDVVAASNKTADYLERQGHDALLHALVILSGICVLALAAMVKVAYSVHRDVVALTRECNAASKDATAADVLLAGKIHNLTEELKSRPCVADRNDRRDYR